MANESGNNGSNKKFSALAEIVAATVFCIVGAVCCVQLHRSISDLSGSTTAAVNSYIIVVEHGKEVFCETYRTIPQHRKTIREIRICLNAVGRVCASTARAFEAIPNNYGWKWLAAIREFPRKLYHPFGELEKSLASSQDILDTLDEKKYNDIIAAFDKTRAGLEDTGKTVPAIGRRLIHIIFLIFGFAFFVAVLVFGHGLALLRECRDLPDADPAVKEK